MFNEIPFLILYSFLLICLIAYYFVINKIYENKFQKDYVPTNSILNITNSFNTYVTYLYFSIIAILLITVFLSIINPDFYISSKNILGLISLVIMWLAFIFTFSSVIISLKNDTFLITKSVIISLNNIQEKLFVVLLYSIISLAVLFISQFINKYLQSYDLIAMINFSYIAILVILFFFGCWILFDLTKLYLNSCDKSIHKVLDNLYNNRFRIFYIDDFNSNSYINFLQYFINKMNRYSVTYDDFYVVNEYLDAEDYIDENLLNMIFCNAYIKNYAIILVYIALSILFIVLKTPLSIFFLIIVLIIFFLLLINCIVNCIKNDSINKMTYIANCYGQDPNIVIKKNNKICISNFFNGKHQKFLCILSSTIIFANLLINYYQNSLKLKKIDQSKKIVNDFKIAITKSNIKKINNWLIIFAVICYCELKINYSDEIVDSLLDTMENDYEKEKIKHLIINYFKLSLTYDDFSIYNKLCKHFNIYKEDYYNKKDKLLDIILKRFPK